MYCTVLTCKNNKKSLDKNSEISFHRFPNKNDYKTIWIKATGRDASWLPKKTDSICSEHFKPSMFHIRNKKSFLNGWAVPTLNCTAVSTHQPNETDDEDMDMDISEETNQNKQNTINPSGDDLDDQLAHILFKLSAQNRQIKHLLQRQRRYNARLPNLRDQIVNLNKSNETVCTYLENLGFPIASEVLSRIILCDSNEVNDGENPYSEAFEKFIVTLYSLSPAAYNMIRTTFPTGVFPEENFFKTNCSILEQEFSEV